MYTGIILALLILSMAALLWFRGVLRLRCLGKCVCCPFASRCRRKNACSPAENGEN